MLIFYSPTKVHSPTLLHVLVCFLRIFFLLDSDYLNLKLCKVQLRFKSNLKEWWTWTWEGPKTRYHEIVTNDSHVLIRSKSFLSSSSTETGYRKLLWTSELLWSHKNGGEGNLFSLWHSNKVVTLNPFSPFWHFFNPLIFVKNSTSPSNQREIGMPLIVLASG